MATPKAQFDGHPGVIHYAFDGSILLNKYDLVFHDSNDVKPASSMTDQLTEEKNQLEFARNFAGVAMETRLAADTDAVTKFPVATDIVMEVDCASATFEVGDLVAVDEDSGGTFLEDQKVVKTTDVEKAIGQVIQREASAATRVIVHFSASRKFNKPNIFGASGINTETLAANKTLDLADDRLQALDPGGAGRDVTLPAEASSAGEVFIIKNTADAAEVLTIKDDGAATICTPTQNETAIVYCDGVAWHGIVGANN